MATSKRIPDIRSITFDPGEVKHSPEDRIEVVLSPSLLGSVRAAADALVRQNAYPVPGTDDIERYLADLRDQYHNVCTQLAHRVQTDLNPTEVTLLHFALLKGVMTTVRDTIRDYCSARKQRAEELRQFGSGELLKVQDQLAWFYRHADLVHYRVMKAVLHELRRVENRHLHAIWQKTAEVPFDSSAMLFIPLMAVGDRPTEKYLLEHLFLCEDFTQRIRSVVQEIEECCKEAFPAKETLPLFDQQATIITITNEVSRPPWANFLSGSSDAVRRPVTERFCWLDDPDAIKSTLGTHETQAGIDSDEADTVSPDRQRLRERWKLFRLRRRLVSILRRHGIQASVLATEQTRRLWPIRTGREIDYKEVFRFLVGELPLRKLVAQMPQESERKADLIATLRQSRKDIRHELRHSRHQITLDSLALIARFRSHLKYCRFTHRMFSTIDLVSRSSMAQEQPHHYVVLTTEEIRASNSNPVAHECSLTVQAANMDVLRQVLREQSLEPDDFLNKHFYEPIQKKIQLLGAEQQYRDPGCWQLLLREYQQLPENWHTISHATALAQQILDSGEQLRQQCMQSRLPQPVFSIAIEYHDIQADQPGFSADTERYERSRSAPGDHQDDQLNSRVILTPAAFRKLQQEVMLRQVSRNPSHRTEVFYAGKLQLPDNTRLEVLLKECLRQGRHHHTGEHDVCYELLRQSTRHQAPSFSKRYQPRPMMLQPDK